MLAFITACSPGSFQYRFTNTPFHQDICSCALWVERRFGLTSIAWRNIRHGGDGAKAKFGSRSLRLLERGFKEGKLFPFVCIKQKSTANLRNISNSKFLKNWFIWSRPGTLFWHENWHLSKSHDLIWKEYGRRCSHGLVLHLVCSRCSLAALF